MKMAFVCLILLQSMVWESQLLISTIIKNKEVIKGADVAKGVTVISKQRTPIFEEVEKLLLVYINEI